MSTPALTQLLLLQRSLYERAYEEAHAIVAGTSRTILAYSVAFEKSLPKSFQRATLGDLIDSVRQRRFVLYGDFHTLRQSQRGLLRLIRAYAERQRTNKIVVALEMFKARDQQAINGYLEGRISEQEFLQTVNYHAEWGFPWQNFKMILDYARQRRMPVIGINTTKAGRDTLASRDQYAARCLASVARRYPDHKIMCLIGEYHLADDHLPRALTTELKRRGMAGGTLRILNNIDEYYFQLNQEPTHKPTEYLRLKKDFYCVMNSPPWMKWQSFSMWEEMRSSHPIPSTGTIREMEADPDLYTEDTFDVDYQFLHFVRSLTDFLGVVIDDSDIESFQIHYSPDHQFRDILIRDMELNPVDTERILHRARHEGVYFIPKSNTVLLASISINNLAEAAGQYLHALLSGMTDDTSDQDLDFYQRILKAAVGMISSKILNPRRKCLELQHYRRFVRLNKGKRLSGAAQARRQVSRGVLELDQWLRAQLARNQTVYLRPPKDLVLFDRAHSYELSRSVGLMLGLNLYKKVISNRDATTLLRSLFKRRVESPEALWSEVLNLYRIMPRSRSRL